MNVTPGSTTAYENFSLTSMILFIRCKSRASEPLSLGAGPPYLHGSSLVGLRLKRVFPYVPQVFSTREGPYRNAELVRNPQHHSKFFDGTRAACSVSSAKTYVPEIAHHTAALGIFRLPSCSHSSYGSTYSTSASPRKVFSLPTAV